ncbi:DUF2520 domain-containing protein [candidate division WOR-3 bacterium]|nr:DUF2520 domain-containing protein [candidate division WOR-3 bacterium]
MNIGLIGCGRVGTTLCYLLRRRNKIVGVHDTKRSKIHRTAKVLGLKKNVPLETLCKMSTVIFIATPDDEILNAYKFIEPLLYDKTRVFHFSGALPSTVLPKRRGIHRAAVHPFATFPRLTIPPKRTRFPLYVEGDPSARVTAKRLFRGRSFSVTFISRNDKVYCHLVGVFASNFLVALLYDVSTLMKQAGMSSRDLHEAVLPIIRDTLLNIEDRGLRKSLSGPLQRGDIQTIKQHLKALCYDPVLLSTYKVLSLSILETLPGTKEKIQLQRILNSRY